MTRRNDPTMPDSASGRTPVPGIDRRTLFRTGGLALSLGAIVAACGDDRGGLEEPGRVGVAPPREPLPDADINDVVFLRTAQSIEYTAIDLYALAMDLGALDGRAATLAERFVADHTEHAAAVGSLIVARGGEEFTCANPWIRERVLGPALDATEGTDDLVRDVLNIAYVVETFAGASYQLFVGMMEDPELRRGALMIGAEENRHAAALAMAITGTPEGYFSPALAAEEVLPDDDGFPIPYAVTSRFGQLGGKDLVVGPRNDEGARFTASVQTPAENSYVYEYMSC